MPGIRKNVTASWEKSKDPNLFGGCPVTGPTGRIVKIDVAAFGFVAEFFEQEDIQIRLIEAFRKNNLHFQGFEKEVLENSIKEGVDAFPPQPKVPIFLLKSYGLQSYLSQLIR